MSHAKSKAFMGFNAADPCFQFLLCSGDGWTLAGSEKQRVPSEIKSDKGGQDTGDSPARCYPVFWLGSEGSKRGRQATKFSFLKQREFVTGREEVSG